MLQKNFSITETNLGNTENQTHGCWVRSANATSVLNITYWTKLKNPGVAERAVGYLDHADGSHGRIVAVDGSPLVAKKLQMVVIIT